MTTRKVVAKTTQRRIELEQALQQVEQLEAAQRIEAEIETDPTYKKYLTQVADVGERLHRLRVTLKRKDFAIRVRHDRLHNIPKEIKLIEGERVKVQREVDTLTESLQQLQSSIANLKQRTAVKLKESGLIKSDDVAA